MLGLIMMMFKDSRFIRLPWLAWVSTAAHVDDMAGLQSFPLLSLSPYSEYLILEG